jgi:hypothetical protein
MKTFAPALLFALLTGCAVASEPGGMSEPAPLSAKIAGDYALHALLAANAYHKAGQTRFPVELLGWRQVDLAGQPTDRPTRESGTGLAYDIYEKQDSNEVIFAFRGTDSKRDFVHANAAVGPLRLQYEQARKEFHDYVEKHPLKKVSATGHSLGGGLALTVSCREGKDAVAFDSSPRVSDGLEDIDLPANRVMIFEDGDVLTGFRKLWQSKFDRVVGAENTYKATFDFEGADKHSSYELALGMLRIGATVNPNLGRVLEALPKKAAGRL